MNAEIISIGTELLLGHVINTNTAFLSQKLAELGIDVYNTSVVGDNRKRLLEAIRSAAARSDIVVTTGGLGPTVDDITSQTISMLLRKRMVLNRRVLKDLENYFRFRKMKVLTSSVRQAYVPEGVRCVRNKVGIAPGLITKYNGRIIICLPGPPRELGPMFENAISPYLKKRIKGTWVIKSRTVKLASVPESQVNKSVKRLLKLKPPTTVGIYAKAGQVELRIMAKAKNEKDVSASILKIKKKIREKLKDFIFGYDEDTLESVTGRLLTRRKQTIAVAESCTGGLLANRITNVSGSSKYFIMGLVAYSNSVKENILGVSKESIEKYGAVSQEIAIAMAERIKLLAGSDIGIGITGIAGPGGGTPAKPVGLVYAAIIIGRKKILKEFRFKGTREEIKFQTTQDILELLRKNI
ncbi:MAG: competence/damage-inducible protein A [Candidatus Omnitrophica bacterium]|nr:competence/damage-inducible protein A [Candidatus Omnitrophota bacterium]